MSNYKKDQYSSETHTPYSNTLQNEIILVKKASGEEEPFILDKLARSLKNAGADDSSIENILNNIQDWVFSGITTKQIYSRAFKLLRRIKKSSAMRYRLKQAIIDLGPTGYPFEQFIGQIFEKQGCQINVGVVVEGFFVNHEMDVVATQNNIQHLVECKYHKDQGKNVSIQVPLYVHSRVGDIVHKRNQLPKYKGLNFQGWLITNTRFSEDSILYGTGCGLKLLAWDYPKQRGLKEIVEELRLYPVTILHNLNRKQKQELVNKGIVTCFQLKENVEVLDTILLSDRKNKLLRKELQEICAVR